MEHGSMTPLYNGWSSNRVNIGNRGVKQAQRRKPKEKEHKKKKSDGWALSHPTNGLLATLSGKGWPKRLFYGVSSILCSALSDFFTLLGPFGGHFGVFFEAKSAES